MNTEEYTKIISANLRRLAYEHGKSQAEIAKDIGINKQTLSSWMKGKELETRCIMCTRFTKMPIL